MVVVSVDRETGQIVAGPEIRHSRVRPRQGIDRSARRDQNAPPGSARRRTPTGTKPTTGAISAAKCATRPRNFLFTETRRRPMILPMVMEV